MNVYINTLIKDPQPSRLMVTGSNRLVSLVRVLSYHTKNLCSCVAVDYSLILKQG